MFCIIFIKLGILHAQVYSNQTLHPDIKTVILSRFDSELSPPVINFNSDEQLLLSFDDLRGGYTSYQYTFIHCNSDWTPTDLWQNEYLNGYTDDYIRDYRSSFNTLVPYTNYMLRFPNNQISFMISGNYILKVYPEGDPDNPVIIRRFMIVEKSVTVKGTVRQATDINKRFTHQDIGFSIIHPNYTINEPYSMLKVSILQNFRWDNAKFNVKPYMLRAGEIDYNYTDGTIMFDGLNEFRFVDIKSLRYNSERIRSIEIRNNNYIVDLLHDKVRAFKPYITEQDINGRFLIKTDDGRSSNEEGEYALVNFFIPYEVPFPASTLFIVGGFNQWNTAPSVLPEDGRAQYNYARQGYEARLLLKQGYYNYMYALVDDKTGKADYSAIEGSHSETRNEYTILVYNREQGSRYDKLIAVETFEK